MHHKCIARGGTNATSFTDKQLVAFDGASQVSTTTIYVLEGFTISASTTAQLSTSTGSVSKHKLSWDFVLTAVRCTVDGDGASSTIQADRRTSVNTAGNDIFSDIIECGGGEETASTTPSEFAVTNFSKGDWINLTIEDAEPFGVRPSGLQVHFEGVKALIGQ